MQGTKPPVVPGKTVLKTVTCIFCKGPGHEEKNCWKKAGKCLACGDNNHRIAECARRRDPPSATPKVQGTGASGSGPRTRARVYSLDGSEEPDTTVVVEGTHHISGFSCKILFDPGATHSFISTVFARLLEWPVVNLMHVVEVCTPLGSIV